MKWLHKTKTKPLYRLALTYMDQGIPLTQFLGRVQFKLLHPLPDMTLCPVCYIRHCCFLLRHI